MKLHKIYIGIDTGVNTGLAIWSTRLQKLLVVRTMKIHEAMEIVTHWVDSIGSVDYFETGIHDDHVRVHVEDARLRSWFGETGKEKAQGVGSIKRDAVIWEDFLTDVGCEFEMVHPKNNMTKLKKDAFEKLTGWTLGTNEHGRDAAMLIFGK